MTVHASAMYFARRGLSAIITLLVVLVLVFFVFQVIGDPARRTLPINSSDEQVEAFATAHGYRDPILEQFWRHITGAVRLDFGISTTAGRPAIEVVLEALPRSLVLAVAGMVLVIAFGTVIGTVAGLYAGGRIDRALQWVASIAASVPEFWSGLMLIIVFAVGLRILPTGGYGGVQYLVLPAVAMAIPPTGRFALVVRESVRETMQTPFILVARAKGLRWDTVVFAHVIRAAVVPIVSIGGLEVTRMAVGGVVVIEAVFAWPGIGRLYLQAMQRYDVPLVSATLFIATVVVLILNLALDVAYTRLDKRIVLARSR